MRPAAKIAGDVYSDSGLPDGASGVATVSVSGAATGVRPGICRSSAASVGELSSSSFVCRRRWLRVAVWSGVARRQRCEMRWQRAPLAPLRLRIGVRAGEVQLHDDGNYAGSTINRTARREVTHGGQTAAGSRARTELPFPKKTSGYPFGTTSGYRFRRTRRSGEMPVWGWFLAAAIVVLTVTAIVVGLAANRRKRTERLKERFGPEYDRALDEAGEQSAAEKELAARKRKRDKLDIVPLSPQARGKYAEGWREVQTAFVDNPSSALGDADRLVTEVMRERGYPIDDFDQRAADISVDHPTVVENYRAAHSISHAQQQGGGVGTEEQRQAFVHYRALFEKLLETDKDKSQEARA